MWGRDKHRSNFLWQLDPKNRGNGVALASSYFDFKPNTLVDQGDST